ncbi:hypothetical protein S245_014011, partial [Arachis hypogaea]
YPSNLARSSTTSLYWYGRFIARSTCSYSGFISHNFRSLGVISPLVSISIDFLSFLSMSWLSSHELVCFPLLAS